MNNNKYILFYSNFCSNSKEFITELYKTKYYELFMKVCVDKKNIKIPKQITSVPTIIVPNYPRPLTGGEAFFWLEGMGRINIEKEQSNLGGQQQMGGPKKKVEGEFGNQTGSDSITPFSYEMKGYSDAYTYLDNNNALDRNFSFLNGSGNQNLGGGGNIPTPKEMGEFDKKQKDSEVSQAYERLMEERNRDFKGVPRI
jgi:hypothetical protein